MIRWLSAVACCAVGFVCVGTDVPKRPTYSANVAPILRDHCIECHRPNDVAPFSLVGYANAKKHADMLALVTASRRMPPWKAVAGYGEFHDANVLTADEMTILRRWADTGMARGDAKQEPKLAEVAREWSLGKPDLVLSPNKPFVLGSEGPDVYRDFVLPTSFDKPMWVTAMDVKPGNRAVVHHIIAYIDGNHEAARKAAANTDGQEGFASSGAGPGFDDTGALGGWAPGLRARHLAPGTAFLVPAGANIVMQVHYHRTGKTETDQTKLALYFAQAPPKKEVKILWLANPFISIPAGEKAATFNQTVKIPKDCTLYSVMPHMHLLGQSMKAWLERPDGAETPLIAVRDWDFNWQLNYVLKEPLKVSKGSKIHVTAVYDNSAQNPHQPNDPPKRVRWGEQTTDEMMLLVCQYTVDDGS